MADIQTLPYFEIEDVLSFIALADTEKISKGDLSTFLLHYFPHMLTLKVCSTFEPIMYKGEYLKYYWSSIKNVTSFSINSLKGEWKSKTNNTYFIRHTYKGVDKKEIAALGDLEDTYHYYSKTEKEFWRANDKRKALIYHDLKNKTLYLSASTESGLDLLGFLISDAYPHFADELWDIDFEIAKPFGDYLAENSPLFLPWVEIEKLFKARSDDKIENEELILLNKLLKELNDAYKLGKEVDLKRLSEKYGIDEKEIISIQEQLDSITNEKFPPFKIPAEDQIYQIGYRTPPPALLTTFESTLDDESSPFIFYDNHEIRYLYLTLTNHSFITDFGSDDLGNYFLSLFEKAFSHHSAPYIMNTLFYLLLESKGELIYVRSIAYEMLKLFGNVLLPELKMEAETFIEKLSRFLLKHICPNALSEITKRPSIGEAKKGTYKIQGTQLLYQMIELKQ